MNKQYNEADEHTVKWNSSNIRKIYYSPKAYFHYNKESDSYKLQKLNLEKRYRELEKMIKLQKLQQNNHKKFLQYPISNQPYIPLSRPLNQSTVIKLPNLKNPSLPTKRRSNSQDTEILNPASPLTLLKVQNLSHSPNQPTLIR